MAQDPFTLFRSRYPVADVGSEHNTLMIKMYIKVKKPKNKQTNHQMELNLLKHEEYKRMYDV